MYIGNIAMFSAATAAALLDIPAAGKNERQRATIQRATVVGEGRKGRCGECRRSPSQGRQCKCRRYK